MNYIVEKCKSTGWKARLSPAPLNTKMIGVKYKATISNEHIVIITINNQTISIHRTGLVQFHQKLQKEAAIDICKKLSTSMNGNKSSAHNTV